MEGTEVMQADTGRLGVEAIDNTANPFSPGDGGEGGAINRPLGPDPRASGGPAPRQRRCLSPVASAAMDSCIHRYPMPPAARIAVRTAVARLAATYAVARALFVRFGQDIRHAHGIAATTPVHKIADAKVAPPAGALGAFLT